MNISQQLLHSMALQKHTNIYLGSSPTISPSKLRIKQSVDIDTSSAFKSIQNQSTRQQLIEYIKSHKSIIFQNPQKVQTKTSPITNIFQNQMSFQKYCNECNKQQQEQKKLVSQFMKARKKQRQSPKTPIQTTSVLVPSYLQSLISDIQNLQNVKNRIKMKYYYKKQFYYLQKIKQINEQQLKPLLNDYMTKIMGVSINEQTQLDELEVLMVLTMSEKSFEGRPKKELLELLLKNLKQITSEQRQYKLTNQ